MKTLENVMVVKMAAAHINMRNLQSMANKLKPGDHEQQRVDYHGELKVVLQVGQNFLKIGGLPIGAC